MKVGISVECVRCHRRKAPRGRSVPPEVHSGYCTGDQCDAYWKHPEPGDLWPGESESDFGYPVSGNATKEIAV